MKDYQEDPFHNRNSVRYPMDYSNNKPYSKQYERASKQQQRPLDPYLDSFVLPYQHQTGSKLSLDDYARKLGDLQGYQTPSTWVLDLDQVLCILMEISNIQWQRAVAIPENHLQPRAQVKEGW